MTLAEFKELCQREWNECRGEVVTLWLTEESYRELHQYAMENAVLSKEDGRVATRVVYDRNDVPSNVHLSLSTLVNPVTRNTVRMKLAKDQAADCFSTTTKVMYTKVLS